MNIQELIKEAVVPIITTILATILSKIFFIKPLKRHQEIKSKIIKLRNNFIDTNNRNQYDSMTIRIIERQFKDIKEILDMIDETIETNKIFSFLFGYNELRIYIQLLFEYNRNPIMLTESKEFKEDYRMNLDFLFKKIMKMMKLTGKILIILVVLFIFIVIGYYFIRNNLL